MRISDVRLTVVEKVRRGPADEVRIKGQRSAGNTEHLLVEVLTDEGPAGETFALGNARGMAEYLAANVRPWLVGRDPADREAIWQRLFQRDRLLWNPTFVIGTIDVALWDLYGKVVGQPVYQLLGAYRHKMPVYASSMTHATVEEFVEEALDYRQRGYRGYKLHVWGDPARDVEACAAVRAAVGDDFPLMIDVVAAYGQAEALRVGRALEELGFRWYEEPLRDYDIHGYRMLADKLDIPVMAVEVNEGHLYTTAEYITTRAIDIVRSDVSFKGGISQVRKTAALAEAFGMDLEIHANALTTLDAANLHCALSIKNTSFFEQIVPGTLFGFGTEEPLHIDDEGYVHAPTGPGLGMRIDREWVAAHTVAEV